MANEITVTGSLTAYKPAAMTSGLSRAVTGLTFTMTGSFVQEGVMSAGTSATVIPLGSVTQPHWAFFRNLDATNFLTIRNGAAGADLVKLLAGECAIMPLLDTAVPYAVANTLACLLEYLIVSL